MLHFLPRETDVPGWEIISDKIRKKPVQINSADYNKYGLRYLIQAEFRSFSDKDKIIEIKINKLNSQYNAFCMFSIERGFDNIIRNVKENYYSSDYGVYGIRGEYYIQVLSASNVNDELLKELDHFFNVVVSNIKEYYIEKSLPSYLLFFSNTPSTIDTVVYKNGHESIPYKKNIIVKRIILFEKQRLIFF